MSIPKRRTKADNSFSNEPTRAGRALLSILADPSSAALKVPEICKRANISRTTYYELWYDERFLNEARKLREMIIRAGASQVYHKLIKEAIKGGEASHIGLVAKLVGDLVERHEVKGEVSFSDWVERMGEIVSKKKSKQ